MTSAVENPFLSAVDIIHLEFHIIISLFIPGDVLEKTSVMNLMSIDLEEFTGALNTFHSSDF